MVEISQQMGDEETEPKNNPEKLKTISSKLAGWKDIEQSELAEDVIPGVNLMTLYFAKAERTQAEEL